MYLARPAVLFDECSYCRAKVGWVFTHFAGVCLFVGFECYGAVGISVFTPVTRTAVGLVYGYFVFWVEGVYVGGAF
jgi:hypothetical protein